MNTKIMRNGKNVQNVVKGLKRKAKKIHLLSIVTSVEKLKIKKKIKI